jgi:GGDEF domain-containing protein
VSVGWATWDGDDLERFIARADRGLYAAKESGRDCVKPGDSAGAPFAS